MTAIESQIHQQAPRVHCLMQELDQAKAEYLEAREELKSVHDQMQRNQRSLEAARAEANDLNQEWRSAAHQSGLRASSQIRKILDASIEARGNADRLAMLVEEGPSLFKATQEQVANARKRYLQILRQARGPILKARAEAGLSALKEIDGIAAFFAEVNGHLRNLYDNIKADKAPMYQIRQGTSVQDDERDLNARAMELTLVQGLVPMLKELGLDLEAEIPDYLVPIPPMAIEERTQFE